LLAIDENQCLLGQKATQVKLDGTVAAVANVQVNSSTRLLRDELLQISGTANTEFFDILRPVGVHRVRAGLFRSGNVWTGHDDAFDLRRGPRTRGRLCTDPRGL